MNSNFFSFIIPIYNAESHIPLCLESIYASSDPSISFEVILVNDGSSDGSLEICKSYEAKYENVKVFSHRNAGVSATRNVGIREAQGTYICFIDADDAVTPSYMTEIFGKARSQEVDMIQLGYERVGRSNAVSFVPTSETIYKNHDSYFDNERYTHGVWSYIIRRKIISDNKLIFDTNLRYSEDQDFLNKCFLHAKNIMTIKKILYNYNDVPTSAVNKPVDKNRALSQLFVIKNLLTHIQERGLSIAKYQRRIVKQLIDDFYFYAKRSSEYDLNGIVNDYRRFFDMHFSTLDISDNRMKLILSQPKFFGKLFIPLSKVRNKLRTKKINI